MSENQLTLTCCLFTATFLRNPLGGMFLSCWMMDETHTAVAAAVRRKVTRRSSIH